MGGTNRAGVCGTEEGEYGMGRGQEGARAGTDLPAQSRMIPKQIQASQYRPVQAQHRVSPPSMGQTGSWTGLVLPVRAGTSLESSALRFPRCQRGGDVP